MTEIEVAKATAAVAKAEHEALAADYLEAITELQVLRQAVSQAKGERERAEQALQLAYARGRKTA
jgi:hypothetical protein